MSFFNKFFGANGNHETNHEKKQAGLQWQVLNTETQLDDIVTMSVNKPMAIFKHSTRCSISSMAKQRLERNWDLNEDVVQMYYLDLIAYRAVSNAIAEKFGVIHASPQLIVLKNKRVVHHSSHNNIGVPELKNALEQ